MEKSKLSQMESLAETIKNYFGSKDADIYVHMEKLLGLIKEERANNDRIREALFQIANRL